jgi:hypothetical protein
MNNELIDLEKKLISATKSSKELLNAKYPDEIEYYACALELIDSAGTTVNFFSFPVMPTNIQQPEISNTNIKKTHTGVAITSAATFTPFDIQINGNFGRMFRKISNQDNINSNRTQNSSRFGFNGNMRNITVTPMFSSEYKSGYGNIRILQELCRSSKLPDGNSKPQKLIFYNLSLNSHYMVEVMNFTLSMTRDMNFIWNYSLSMKAVAPASAVLQNSNFSIKELRSFSKKNVAMSSQSSSISSLLSAGNKDNQTPIQKKLSQPQKGIKKLLKSVTDTAVGNSAYNYLITFTQHSIENNEFLASIGHNSILNHIPNLP